MADHVSYETGDGASVDFRLAGGRLTIDLDALGANYRRIASQVSPARVAGVVKADAYGLGAQRIAPALAAQGCRSFFVAMPNEGLALRPIVPDAQIFVLSGPLDAEAVPAFRQARLVPVLNSASDLALWEAHGWDGSVQLPCAIHVDTGMTRLGLDVAEATSFSRENALTKALLPILLMSHLSCGDDPGNPMNQQQLATFQTVGRSFQGIPCSLANSAGCFLGPDFALDLVRPGVALYGGAPHSDAANPMAPVVTAEARIIQLRHAKAGTPVSYGAAHHLERDSLIAVAAVGYADGFHRASSGAGVPLRDASPSGGEGFLNGKRVRVLGRVTMDLTLFDVTDLGPDGVRVGDHVELFGANLPIDEAARNAGTIAYELLTSLGQRYHRHYVGGAG